MKDTYNTIAFPSPEILYKEKNSKFFGYAFPVTNEDEIKEQKKESEGISVKIAKLEKRKKELLNKISRVQEELLAEVPGDDEQKKIENLKQRILTVIKSSVPT